MGSRPEVGARAGARGRGGASAGRGGGKAGRDGPESRRQAGGGGRALSENLELLSLKRLTLTSSQSVPRTGTLSLSRTASAVFSRSFEQVSNALAGHAPGPEAPPPRCSLQEDRPAPTPPRLSPAQHKRHSPSISIHLSTDL
ncbi:hypothetical protein AAFF_G00362910 [Aldrovandia affinis]|uniref:Uncharacterized protein n=1 Tax=Aldrovandia affinis TaxID=143900 RepID=A0AAD7R586_9TELE|nr:hypothetical protein AAFF_G00362910 [Aldrovandia affinis]